MLYEEKSILISDICSACHVSHIIHYSPFFIQHFVSSMEIGNNGYHNERSQGIPDPMMTR